MIRIATEFRCSFGTGSYCPLPFLYLISVQIISDLTKSNMYCRLAWIGGIPDCGGNGGFALLLLLDLNITESDASTFVMYDGEHWYCFGRFNNSCVDFFPYPVIVLVVIILVHIFAGFLF